MSRIRLERRYRFSASHLYRRPDWSEEENRRQFGKCANLPGHGHNYRLAITLRGDPDPLTGFVVDLAVVDGIVQTQILERLDHQHLNAAVPEFAPGSAIPSSENLAIWIQARVKPALPEGVELVGVRVEEDDDLAAEWRLE